VLSLGWLAQSETGERAAVSSFAGGTGASGNAAGRLSEEIRLHRTDASAAPILMRPPKQAGYPLEEKAPPSSSFRLVTTPTAAIPSSVSWDLRPSRASSPAHAPFATNARE
jgi:hypothetical protein